MLGEDEHLRGRKGAANHARRFQTVHVRHADVHDDQVGMKLAGLLHGVLPIHRLPADVATLLRRDSSVARIPRRITSWIVGDQNSHSSSPSLCDTRKMLPPTS